MAEKVASESWELSGHVGSGTGPLTLPCILPSLASVCAYSAVFSLSGTFFKMNSFRSFRQAATDSYPAFVWLFADLFVYVFTVMLGIQPRTSCPAGKHATTTILLNVYWFIHSCVGSCIHSGTKDEIQDLTRLLSSIA